MSGYNTLINFGILIYLNSVSCNLILSKYYLYSLQMALLKILHCGFSPTIITFIEMFSHVKYVNFKFIFNSYFNSYLTFHMLNMIPLVIFVYFFWIVIALKIHGNTIKFYVLCALETESNNIFLWVISHVILLF